MRLPVSLIAVLTCATLAGCEFEEGPVAAQDGGGFSEPPPAAPYVYAPPAYNADGWATGDLGAADFDVARIEAMMTGIVNGAHPGIVSVAIARNGKLLLHWHDEGRYLDDYDAQVGNMRRDVHALHSVTKSVTSALVGIAMDQGYVTSTDTGFYSLFSYAHYAHWDDRKYNMTLDDALTMRLGLTWDEWSTPYSSTANSLAKLSTNYDDWAKALLDLPMARSPGTDFEYNTAASTAIGQAVENVTGMPLDLFADAYLFDPMSIATDRWTYSPTGLAVGGSGLFLSTRDLVKFGQLWLDGGTWKGRRLVSADYVAASVTPWVDVSAEVNRNSGYGYQWWLGQFVYNGTAVDYWLANGYGGQFLVVVPSLDLVVAFAGRNFENAAGAARPYMLIESYVLAAM